VQDPVTDTIIVRPIIATERATWDVLTNKHHYPGFRVIVSESLRYVAFPGNRPVALIGWGTAAFNLKQHKFLPWCRRAADFMLEIL